MRVENSFEEIIEKYQQKIYKIVFSFINNETDTDDIVQQTFVNAFKGYKHFKGKASVETWLIRIAVNNVKSFFRKKKFLSLFYIFGDQEIPVDIKDGSPSVESVVENKMISKAVNKAIEQLPSRQKEVFILKHIDGLSISEIAQILDIAEGSIKANIFKAVNNLRKSLGGVYEV
ncbi:MAG: sigma-70 family RNA polymerase sigma factor [Elusimicrobia bacterium]|nr:sigma-70 family RNA polymerase sigma factor [Elusimicrobiota bacterium]